MKLGVLTGVWYLASRASLVERLVQVKALGFQSVDLQGIFRTEPRHMDKHERQAVPTKMKTMELA